ncbi:MAG: cell division ATP-binding protein FtsE [Clostridia bacterium]
MIRVDSVTKRYPNGHLALDNVSLTIARGEFVFVVGPSGAGKSSLIRLLYHEEVPTSGEVYVDQFRLRRLRRNQVPRLRRLLGVVFQDVRLLPDRDVYHNVAFAMQVVEASPREIKKRVPQMLELVGLQDRSHHFPHQLSGGEQQRVGLARALVNNPHYLLADEPTGNLDPETASGIVQLLVEINRRGSTIVMATHARDIVNRMNRRVVAIESGHVARDEERGRYEDDGPGPLPDRRSLGTVSHEA